MNHYLIALLVILGASNCAAQNVKPIEESSGAGNSIGYASVHEALTALKAKPGVNITVTKPDAWTIVNESSPVFAIWSFTPEGHYAYPAVVRRTLDQSNGRVSVVTAALCQATKPNCDRLMQEFQQLNEQTRNQYRPASSSK